MALLHHGTWHAFKRKISEDRKELVEQLVSHQDEISSADLRGRIAMLDEIIDRYPRELSETESDDE